MSLTKKKKIQTILTNIDNRNCSQMSNHQRELLSLPLSYHCLSSHITNLISLLLILLLIIMIANGVNSAPYTDVSDYRDDNNYNKNYQSADNDVLMSDFNSNMNNNDDNKDKNMHTEFSREYSNKEMKDDEYGSDSTNQIPILIDHPEYSTHPEQWFSVSSETKKTNDKLLNNDDYDDGGDDGNNNGSMGPSKLNNKRRLQLTKGRLRDLGGFGLGVVSTYFMHQFIEYVKNKRIQNNNNNNLPMKPENDGGINLKSSTLFNNGEWSYKDNNDGENDNNNSSSSSSSRNNSNKGGLSSKIIFIFLVLIILLLLAVLVYYFYYCFFITTSSYSDDNSEDEGGTTLEGGDIVRSNHMTNTNSATASSLKKKIFF